MEVLFMEKKTSLGIPENLTAAISYVFFFISGFIVLILEKENKFVRFHAMQSFATFLLLWALSQILLFIGGFIPFIGTIGAGICVRIIRIICTILWLVCIFKAFKGKIFKVPVIGEVIEKQINK